MEGRRGILLTACDAVGAGLLPNKAGTNAGGGTVLTSAGPLSTDIALRIGTVSGDEACANTRAFIASTRCLDLLNLSGALNPSEETIAIDENMVGPEFFGTAGLGEHIARLVLGEEGTGGRLEATTILPVTRRLALKVGILPAEVDGVASLQRITGSLATGLIKTDDGVSGLVNRSARGGEAVALIGDLVVLVDADGLLFVSLLVKIRAVDGNIVRYGGFRGGGRSFGLDGALHGGEEAVGVGEDLVGPGGVGAACLGVDIASRTKGHGAGGRIEVSAGAEVAGRPPLVCGIPPAELDGVATGKVVACGLAGGLVEIEEGLGDAGTVGRRAGGRLPIEFVGELVVSSGAGL